MDTIFYNQFEERIKSFNIDELNDISEQFSNKINRLYGKHDKTIKNLFLKYMPTVNIISITDTNINVGVCYENNSWLTFDIYLRDNNYFDPSEGQRLEINTSTFGSFDVMKYSKYCAYFNAVSNFISNEELKEELFKVMSEYHTEIYDIQEKISIIDYTIDKIELEIKKEDEKTKAKVKAGILKINFANTDLTNKYVVLVESEEHCADIIYRKKFYKSVFNMPLSMLEIMNKFSKDKSKYTETEIKGKRVEASKVKIKTE